METHGKSKYKQHASETSCTKMPNSIQVCGAMELFFHCTVFKKAKMRRFCQLSTKDTSPGISGCTFRFDKQTGSINAGLETTYCCLW
jgi:hypothetical protein